MSYSTVKVVTVLSLCTVLCSVLQHCRTVMALRQSQGSRAVPDHSQCTSSPPEQTAKHSRDKVNPEEPHSGNTESQSSTPIPDTFAVCDSSVSGEDFDHGDSPIHHDSMEEDSLSEYDNVCSEEEEEQDYEDDEELRTDADGMTYYVHCCPEDESYLDGIDCHESAESNNKPRTSEEPDAGRNSGDTWEISKGFYEVIQHGTQELVNKCPEPITESTFMQAPMAEDEEDDEEDVEEEDDDDEDVVEEDETYFAGKSQDEIVCKGQCDLQEDSKNPLWSSNYSTEISKAEGDSRKDYKVDEGIPVKCKGDAQRSLMGQREGIKKSTAEAKVDYSEIRDVCGTDTKQGSRFKGNQISKEDRGSRNCRFDIIKPKETENRDFKKRHGKEKREDSCLCVGSDSPKDSIGKGHGLSYSYSTKTGRNRERSVDKDEDMDQIVNEVRTKIKVGLQNTGADNSIAEKLCDMKSIPEDSQASVLRPHRKEGTPSAPNTPIQSLDPQLQKDLARPTKEDCLWSSKGQVTAHFS